MCSICHFSICPSGCPNAPDPAVFAECGNCGADIHEGEEYYKAGEYNFCMDCVSCKTAEVEA